MKYALDVNVACLYVALAERERCELVSADTRMVATLKPMFPFVIELASLP